MNDSNKEQQEAFAQLALAYAHVFGLDGKRMIHQQLVWDDLQKRGYMRSSTIIASSQGACDPFRFAVAEGRRQMVLELESILSSYERMANSEKHTKPKVNK
jgi:hypothetical protein